MNTAVAATEPPRTPVQLFVGSVLSSGKREEIARALPAHIQFDRFERNLANAVMREPKLLRVDPRVVFREVCKIAALGLVLDPQLGEAYLIVDRHNDVQARVGYRGLMKLAHQSGKVSAIYAHDICEFDHCKISLGTEKNIVHEPDFMKPRGQVGAYYAVVRFKDGTTDFEPMSLNEINAIRDRSDAYRAFSKGLIKSTPWATDPGEMGKKTVLRRMLKRVPMSPDLESALSMEDEADERDKFIEPSRPVLRSLGEKLDALAAPAAERTADEPSREEPEAGSSPKTTADVPAQTHEKGDAAEPESEVMPDADDGRSSPRSQDATHVTPPSQPEADAAAGWAQAEPTTSDEYLDYAEAWIIAAVDADAIEAQWREEKRLRAKLGVSVDDAKALAEKLTARTRALRGKK